MSVNFGIFQSIFSINLLARVKSMEDDVKAALTCPTKH